MNVVSFDLETHLIDDGLLAPRLVCLAYRYLEAPSVAFEHGATTYANRHARPEYDELAGLLDYGAALAWVRSALADPKSYFVNQTIAFDFGCLAAEDPSLLPAIFKAYDEGRVSCTKIRERLIAIALGTLKDDDDNRAKFDLATLAMRYTKRDRSAVKGPDAWRLRYGELEGVPLATWPAEAVSYPLGDVEDAIDVWTCQIEAAERAGILAPDGYRLVNEPEQSAAAFALHLLGCWGIRSNAARVATLAAHVAERSATLDALKHAHGLFNAPKFVKGIEQAPTSNKKALQALVLAAFGSFDAAPKTPGRVDKAATAATGREVRIPEVATDKETLLASGDPVLSEIAAAGDALSAVRTTFLPALVRGINVPVCPSWQAIVATGRVSCWAPNLTNQPKFGGVRECWEARPGSLFFNADYSMAELRSLAQVTYTLFGHSTMRDALNEGKELHLLTAAGILGITYEECLRRFKAGDKEAKEARQVAKHCNFGLGGGMGAETFIRTVWLQSDRKLRLGATPEEAIARARELKRLWIATYPEMAAYFRYISEMGDCFELHQHVSRRLRGGLSYCSGANTLFQGLTADGVKASLYFASRECYTGESPAWAGRGKSPLYGCRLNAMIHDELMGEAPEARAHEAAVRLGEVMIHGMSLYTPDVAVVVEPVIMRRWYKEAKPVFDPNGRLVPWEPEARAA